MGSNRGIRTDSNRETLTAHRRAASPSRVDSIHRDIRQVPYGQQGGFGPQPPKKSKTGLWVGLGIGVVAVVVFVITAFVAPGFLLSDDDDDSTSGGGGNSSGAQALAEKIHDGLIANDTATLQQLACPDATDMVQGAIEPFGIGDVRIDGRYRKTATPPWSKPR